jgi:outer membrane protein OmpA-like peptidoglycan-associated protein
MKILQISVFTIFICSNVLGQHFRLKHFRPHGHEEHLHFKPAINHCKAMAAYGHHLHHHHVEHVTEVTHNVPISNPMKKNKSSDSIVVIKNEITKDSIKTEPIKTPDPVNKIKSNPRIAKYNSKIDSLDSGGSFDLPAINFISNQDELAVANMDSFMEAAEFAKNGYLVLIEGHTDDRGSDEYNMKLSMKRVEKIKQLMVQLGVPEDNISVVGNGERTPLFPNTSEEYRLKNRRIEFKIFKM